MKLQISFDMPDLQKAVSVATQVAEFCDILEVGTILIHKHGVKAVEEFRKALPDKTILADAKIVDRGKNAATLFAQYGANWITVMAGTSKQVIHTACTAAKELGAKVMLDLLDARSPGQSAMEAKNLGVDAVLFHQPHDEKDELLFLDSWSMISGNTEIPVFISAKISRQNVDHIIDLKPAGIVVGKSITDADNPAQEAQFFYDLLKK